MVSTRWSGLACDVARQVQAGASVKTGGSWGQWGTRRTSLFILQCLGLEVFRGRVAMMMTTRRRLLLKNLKSIFEFT
jgi:hypothetical protein